MTEIALLTLIVPIGLEETLVDWLLEQAPDQGFWSGPVNGHSADHEQLTIAEQVSGRKRQIRFEIHAPEPTVSRMIEQLRRDFPGAAMHFWIAPLSGAGRL